MRGPNRGGVLATNIISSPITVVPVLVKLIGSGVETIVGTSQLLTAAAVLAAE